MDNVAVLFAGQGSQYLNMGKEFYDKYDYVKSFYDKASEILGYDLKNIVFENNELINQTLYTQPAILVTSIIIYEVLVREYKLKPTILAGFSLGEYSALYASGIFDFETIVYLISKRAHFMEEATKLNDGAMAAIIGLEENILNNLCKETSNEAGIVQIANYNCPGQLVVGGNRNAVLNLCEKAKNNGAKRAIMLNVSGGFHTPLMTYASEKMFDVIKDIELKGKNVDVIMNCSGELLNVSDLKQLMKRQINSPVLFESSIKKIINLGITTFIEIGPGSVLSGFVRKIDKSLNVINIDKLNDLNQL